MTDSRPVRLTRAFALLCLAALAGHVFGADLVGSGDRLQMLQKVQGSWQRACRKIVVDGNVLYEQTRLVVNFTHLRFKTTEFANPECTGKLRQYQTVYGYRLGELIELDRGKTAYALDLEGKTEEPGVIHLPTQNLMAYDQGYLMFGAKAVGAKATERSTRLDRNEPFKRY